MPASNPPPSRPRHPATSTSNPTLPAGPRVPRAGTLPRLVSVVFKCLQPLCAFFWGGHEGTPCPGAGHPLLSLCPLGGG